MSKFFLITVEDSDEVYESLEHFKIEVETMVRAYILPADVVRIEQIAGLEPEITTREGGKEGPSPAGSPASALELNTDHYTHGEFHDVAGANL